MKPGILYKSIALLFLVIAGTLALADNTLVSPDSFTPVDVGVMITQGERQVLESCRQSKLPICVISDAKCGFIIYKRVGVEGNALGAYVLSRALDLHGIDLGAIDVVQLEVNAHVDAFTNKPQSRILSASGRRMLQQQVWSCLELQTIGGWQCLTRLTA